MIQAVKKRLRSKGPKEKREMGITGETGVLIAALLQIVATMMISVMVTKLLE